MRKRLGIRNKDFAFSMRTRPAGYAPVKGLRSDNLRWGLEAPAADVEMALFDLRRDPLERFNVAENPEYEALAGWFRIKLGNIVLGDGRVECDWTREDAWHRSDFAIGSDDKRLEIPAGIIPGS